MSHLHSRIQTAYAKGYGDRGSFAEWRKGPAYRLPSYRNPSYRFPSYSASVTFSIHFVSPPKPTLICTSGCPGTAPCQ